MTALFYSRRKVHPALFLDMRLGKTLVVIRRVLTYKTRNHRLGLRVLVVAPGSALDSWQDQLEDEDIAYHLLKGTRHQRLDLLDANDRRFYLINKEGFLSVPEIGAAARCAKCNGRGKVPDQDTKRTCWTCRGKGYNLAPARVKWDVVILDESVFIKEPRSKVTKFFLSSFKFVTHRWLLTGLPNPEGSLNYVCQLLFLHKTFMGFNNFWSFRAANYRPDPRGYGYIPKPGVTEKINKHVAEHCLVMRRKDVNLEVDKVRETRKLDLSPKARKVYRQAEREFILEAEGLESESTLWRTTQYVWLRRIAGGVLVDKDTGKAKVIWPGKLNELKYLITTELANEAVVVWFNFNAEIAEAHNLLSKVGVNVLSVTGDDKYDERRDKFKAFRSGCVRVLLLQQAIAQTGVNLSVADTAIYYSEPVGLNARRQTEERILKIGKPSLLLINLLVRDTVDEDVRRALQLKGLNSNMSLSQALILSMRGRHEKTG